MRGQGILRLTILAIIACTGVAALAGEVGPVYVHHSSDGGGKEVYKLGLRASYTEQVYPYGLHRAAGADEICGFVV